MSIEKMRDSGKTKAELLKEVERLRKRVAGLEQDKNITELKPAEDTLRESEKWFREIIENTAVGVYRTTPGGRILIANPALVHMLGYSSLEELIQLNLEGEGFEPQYRRSTFKEEIEREGRIVSLESTWITRDGKKLHVIENVRAVRDEDGKTLYYEGTAENITERKRAEESLRESENKHRTLLENLPQKIFFKDRNSVYISCNDNLAEDFKVKSEEIAGKTDYDFFHKELAEQYRADDKRVMASGEAEDIEEKYIQQGQDVVVHTVKTPVKDAQGNVIGILGIFWDITEQKRAEEALRESEEKFRTFMETASDLMHITDKDGNLTYVNDAMAGSLGYSKDEMIGMHLTKVLSKEETKKHFDRKLKELITAGEIDIESVWSTKDGKEIYGQTKVVAVYDRDGNFVGGRGILRDITEQKRADEALRESEERYRTLVESAGETIVMVNKDGVYLFMNGTAAKRLGGKPEDYVGKTIWDAFPKKIADRQMAIIRKVISKGEGMNSITQTEMQGQFRWFNATIEPLRDSSGKVTTAMVIARDIHELKLAEEELGLYREKMAQAEQLASLGTLSATLAHELNQPLTAIHLSIENSLAEMETISCPGSVIEDLRDGLSAVSDVTSKVNVLRDFARKSSDEIISEVNLKEVAERILKLLRENARRARVSLHLRGMDQLPSLYTNEKDTEQLFFALIENAVQAADGKQSHRLIISGDVKDEHIGLRFADTCSGIAPENLDKIFEPFFTTGPVGERTGLGLCIVERIVSGAGGKIRVESKASKGTTFYITLPINEGKLS